MSLMVHNCNMKNAKLLIVDDDTAFQRQLHEKSGGMHDIEQVCSLGEFRELFRVGRYDLILLDIRLPRKREGLGLMRDIQALDPAQPVIIATAYADLETHLEALELGAIRYIDKTTCDIGQILTIIEEELEKGRLRRELRIARDVLLPDYIGISESATAVRAAIEEAGFRCPRLIIVCGEVGAGRWLVAERIRIRAEHRMNEVSHKVDGSSVNALDSLQTALSQGGFVIVTNGECLGDNHFAAFENAVAKIPQGRSTVCLILRGGDEGSDLTKFKKSDFPKTWIDVPPLSERIVDIPILAQSALQTRNQKSKPLIIDPQCWSLLQGQSWLGNIEELLSTVTIAAVRADAQKSEVILPEHFSQHKYADGSKNNSLFPFDYTRHCAWAEMQLIENLLAEEPMLIQNQAASCLGYKSLATLRRHVRDAFRICPELSSICPRTRKLFPTDTAKTGGNE